ncbi:Molybdopterin-guanine dinucleotide biosynthesis adapter protein [Sporotomaculum syntrophicum]|uniref:Molybdopterin-guanine dinucleotide biosynthesis adapter protein n=1 Tax=Sporotomaculum syntrophicum TaxID=182264 RepID=A0A9D2WN43_9FIRM|nr:molybdopterin-guanine dinucleotide biosynthesis protein B [Sporotomaculum syntrophicum]KAF1083791.1 Molybdopterin-guanine dinucleotide biosynthesis adapter protein [Sporotomaculum syntrophicum]
MKVFSVFGVSQSGKTTTVEGIIRELMRRGYRVGSIKNIHFQGFAIDTPGTNTWRHRQAGAEMVVARGLRETDVLIPRQLSIEEILTFFDQDYVVIEGISDTLIPKILCAGDEAEVEEGLNDLVFAISGRISNRLSNYNDIPVINALSDVERLVDLIEDKMTSCLPFIHEVKQCHACGVSCRDLASRILRGKATGTECLAKNEVVIDVGGQELSVDYLRQMHIKNTLIKVLANLDSYDGDKEFFIEIRKRNNGMEV